MSKRTSAIVCMALWAASVPTLASTIIEWGGAPEDDYVIDDFLDTVTILAAGTFKFEAIDGEELGTINKIEAAPGITGTVYLYVAKSDLYGGAGAMDVKLVDLSGAEEGHIKELRIAGNLAADGKVLVSDISGPIAVGEAGSGGHILNDIEVVKLTGDISCVTMRNLTVSGPPDTPPSSIPDIFIYSAIEPYTHTIDVTGELGWVYMWGNMSGQIIVSEDLALLEVPDLVGTVDVGRDLNGLKLRQLTGSITVGRDLNLDDFYYFTEGGTGDLTVGRDLTGGLTVLDGGFGGAISVGRNMPGDIAIYSAGDLTGTITIDGDLSGSVSVGGNLEDVDEDLTGGHIIVNGSLTNGASIVVGGEFVGDPPDTEFIAIDYDGWDVGDTWESGATITVNGVPYTENTPEERIWEITSCKADMNNDELVGFFDIDPFVQALNYPDQYALDYAGLSGSRVFHGDLNCDGEFDFFDIDPFVARITEPCCYEECGDCPERFGGEGGGEALSPLEMAIELATHIAPERYDTLVDMIALLAAAQEDAEKAAYWTAVWAALSE